MKKLFLSMVVVMIATMSYAQSNLVATLSHNGEITVFHGANAWKEAMEAADHGDIITLASGRYNAFNITKAVTLRGAGTQEDAVTGTYCTQIIGDFDINIPDSISEYLTMEGIYHNGKIYANASNAILQKCRFGTISFSNHKEQNVNSLICINCYITDKMAMAPYGSAKYINCVINNPSNICHYQLGWTLLVEYGSSVTEFTNCIILGDITDIYRSYLQNSILNTNKTLNNTNMASYCVGYTSDGNGSPFANLSTQATNKVLTQEQVEALFKPETFYELTDAAKAEYIGIDEKEVGIYGGNLPYETRILSPQITKCNVAAKTTAYGKLSVDIEVKAAE